MQHKSNKLLTVGRFAQLAGVTVRTLRFYEQKGLLKPSAHRESGYRMYSLDDLFILEQILTLKFLGLSLDDIRRVLRSGEAELDRLLALQKQAVVEKIAHLSTVAQALDDARAAVQNSGNIDWNTIIHIIQVVKMKNTQEWVEKFYTPEQLETIRSGYTQEEIDASQRAWNDLIDEVRAHVDKDPAAPELQPLVDRWLALINAFTRGDAGIGRSLNTLYANVESAPQEFRDYYNRNSDVFAFMQKAIAARSAAQQ